jgi:hypothetical protein
MRTWERSFVLCLPVESKREETRRDEEKSREWRVLDSLSATATNQSSFFSLSCGTCRSFFRAFLSTSKSQLGKFGRGSFDPNKFTQFTIQLRVIGWSHRRLCRRRRRFHRILADLLRQDVVSSFQEILVGAKDNMAVPNH